MAHETFPEELQKMIDRAGTLTTEETEKLGQLWESEEGLVLPAPSILNELAGVEDYPVVTNLDLMSAWERTLETAGHSNPDRVAVIDAARAAGKAVTRDVRWKHDTESSKNGAEEAVRSAVLAVGVKDLISEADYVTLTSPWQQVLGAL